MSTNTHTYEYKYEHIRYEYKYTHLWVQIRTHKKLVQIHSLMSTNTFIITNMHT